MKFTMVKQLSAMAISYLTIVYSSNLHIAVVIMANANGYRMAA